jgi:WD40 repeat protein
MATSEERLDEVVTAYLQAIDAGQRPDRGEWLARHPEVANGLREFFASEDRLGRLSAPLRALAPPEPSLAATLTAPAGDDLSSPAVPGYEVLEILGQGGMGVVYRARHRALDRVVALKMLLAGGHARRDELARFKAEAEAIARLQHPHIVQVFEVGEHEGQPFFSLEYVDGGSLADRLDGTPLPAREAAELVVTLARAVHAAHEKGIVHRDLKPANVLLSFSRDPEGSASGAPPSGSRLNGAIPKITDFGLAKRLEGGAALTQSGAVVGTPTYMAPEQAAGRVREVGPAADVYALGVILYELLTGRPPFKAETPMDTVLQVLTGEPVAPTRLQPKLPHDLDTVCLKSLEKEPGKRYASAMALADDLDRWLAGEPIAARPAGRLERLGKWARRRPAAAALVAVSAVALAAVLGGGTAFTLRLLDQIEQTDQARRDADEKAGQLQVEVGQKETARKDAMDKAEKLQKKTEELDASLRHSTRLLAGSLIQLADAAWREGHLALARERLDEVPAEERFWDWRYLKRQTEGSLFTLYGHTNLVYGVAFSPDGARLATGSYDGMVQVWDARTGQGLLTLNGAGGGVAFSPDGSRLASASWDNTVKVWDAQTGQELLTLRGHTEWVESMAFSPDGTRLASGSRDGTVKVWDARSGQQLLSLRGHIGHVNSVAFSPDGTRLASAGGELGRPGEVRVWDARSGQGLLTLRGHTFGVSSVAFSPDGARLASGSYDSTVQVWDARTGQVLRTLRGHTNWVYSVAFSPDGTRLASGGGDGTVKVWDASSGQDLLSFLGHVGFVRSVAYSPDGARLASGSADRTVKVWDARAGQEFLTLRGHAGPVESVAFSPDGARLSSGGGDGTVKVWDAHSGEKLRTLRGHTWGVSSVAFSPDGTRLASGGWDQTVKVWEARSGQELLSLRGHTDFVNSVAFSPDGNRLASGGDRTVKVWDARTGQQLLSLRGHTREVLSVAFSPDGAILASAGWDSAVKVWDSRTGQELLSLRGHAGPVESVAFSPNGLRLASGSRRDGAVKVWDARSGQELLSLTGHSGDVTSLAYSPDGARLASGGSDQKVKVWDAHTGQELLTLRGHTREVTSVAFRSDGATLASASGDRTVQVWDAHPGQELHAHRGHTSEVSSAAFSPDGLRLVTTDQAGQRLAWDACTGERLPEVPRLPERLDPARSPDGRTFAWIDGSTVRLIDLHLSEDEVLYRRRVTRPDPEWHAAEAQRCAQSGDWFAAAFHLRQRLQAPPDSIAVRHELALCQLASGQQGAYRQSCAALLEQLDKGLAGERAGLGLLALPPSGGLAALPPLAVAVRLPDELRPAVARVVALAPGTVPAARVLPLAEGADPVTRALLLHRAGKHDDALKLLADQPGVRALLVRALAEQACGRPAEAARALDQAAGTAAAPLSWDERLERDLLRREAEALYRPPPGKAPTGDSSHGSRGSHDSHGSE